GPRARAGGVGAEACGAVPGPADDRGGGRAGLRNQFLGWRDRARASFQRSYFEITCRDKKSPGSPRGGRALPAARRRARRRRAGGVRRAGAARDAEVGRGDPALGRESRLDEIRASDPQCDGDRRHARAALCSRYRGFCRKNFPDREIEGERRNRDQRLRQHRRARLHRRAHARRPPDALGARYGAQGEPGRHHGGRGELRRAAPTEEVMDVCRPLTARKGIYCTHMRDEGDRIVDSLEETFRIGRELGVPVVISHHKLAGKPNHGRSAETLPIIEKAMRSQKIGLDCYPYCASSTILSVSRVGPASKVLVTWSKPHPEFAGMELTEIASKLRLSIPA